MSNVVPFRIVAEYWETIHEYCSRNVTHWIFTGTPLHGLNEVWNKAAWGWKSGYELCYLNPLYFIFPALLIVQLLLQKYFAKDLEEDAGNTSEKVTDICSWNVFDLAKTAYQPGHTEAVVKLVNKFQYDVNYIEPSTGLSLFLCSCLSGEKAVIKYMLKEGADVNATSSDGDTPLYLATYGILNSPTPDVSVIMDLIAGGCDVNKSNKRGYTPLHRAASKGNISVIKCLLLYGADPYQASKAGILPISNAINAGNLEAANLLQVCVDNPHVWDVVDPHTPPRIQLGLQSPVRRHLIESSQPRRALPKVLT